MIETWHNFWRRKLRTTLTILGIVVGTLALTVMGAMSEKINLLVDGALKYYSTRVVVQAGTTVPGQFLGAVLSAGIAEDVREIPDVAAAFPTVYTLYQEEADEVPAASFGFPPLVIGVDARRFDYEEDRYPVVLSSGRLFVPGERGVALVGVDLAKYKGVGLGDALTVRGRGLEIVGIMERTLTARDNVAFVPLADGQDFLAEMLPPSFSADPSALATEIEVYPDPLDRADAVARAINREVKGVRALAPREIERQFSQSLIIFNVIIISSAVIAMVVGGLSILNTMVVAVSDRAREIGIKKAVGATNGDILREFLREATIIGFVGGVVGLGAGTLLTFAINRFVADQGVVIMVVTPRLGIFVIVFTTVLGAAAGLFPALAAARRNPVDALRQD